MIAGAEIKMSRELVEQEGDWEFGTGLEHLETSRQEGICCQHSWQPVPPTPENLRALVALFEEDLAELDLPFSCQKCGAVGLFEQDLRVGDIFPKLWAYDATARFGLPFPKERTRDANQRKGRR